MKKSVMNHRLISLLCFLSLILSGSPVFAQEAAVIEALPKVAVQEMKTPQTLSFMVTKAGGFKAKPGPVFTQGGHYEGIDLPYLISTPRVISYPRWAVRQGWEGKIVIALEILKDGSVGRTKVMHSTGHKTLDQAAEKAIHTWKFHPAVKNGQSIVECIQIPVFFALEN